MAESRDEPVEKILAHAKLPISATAPRRRSSSFPEPPSCACAARARSVRRNSGVGTRAMSNRYAATKITAARVQIFYRHAKLVISQRISRGGRGDRAATLRIDTCRPPEMSHRPSDVVLSGGIDGGSSPAFHGLESERLWQAGGHASLTVTAPADERGHREAYEGTEVAQFA